MSPSIYSAFFIFATIMVVTPGPANLVLMSSGARFGFKKSIPFVVGVTCGKLFLTVGLGFGFLTLIHSNQYLIIAIKIIGIAYICWLSWKILFLQFEKNNNSDSDSSPSFLNGLFVHPLNPKGWAMVIAAYTQFTSFGSTQVQVNWLTEVFIVASTFFVIQAISHSLWCWGGGLIFNFLSQKKFSRQLVLTVLAILTIGTVIYSFDINEFFPNFFFQRSH